MIDPKPGDEGKRVIYAEGKPYSEAGKIVRWNESYVFVKFDRDKTPKAAVRSSLTWEYDNGEK